MTREQLSVTALHAGETLLFLVGFSFIGATGAIHVASVFQQVGGEHRLESLIRAGSDPRREQSSSGETAAATRAEASATGLVGRVEIPRTGLSGIIFEGTSDWTLLRGVGHLSGSAFPGERGTVALAAHRDSYFRLLEDVEAGDVILVTTPDGVFHYLIESTVIVEPNQGGVLGPSQERSLALITCYPFRYVGPAPLRLVVRAIQIEAPPSREEDSPPLAPDPRETLQRAQWVGETIRFGDEPL
jgi:sortase A